MQNIPPGVPKICLLITSLVCVVPSPVFSEPRPSVPTSWEVVSDINRDLDNLERRYKRYFKTWSDGILQDVQTDNKAKRAVIAPLYQRAFGIDILPASTGDAPPDELGNLTDGKLYADAWLKPISDARVESSDYLTKRVAPVLADPRTDPGAVTRIQNDASVEWDKYKPVAANNFSHDADQINADFQTRLAVMARDHRDLREALAAITGPIPAGDFDVNFQKYVAAAESKLPPPAPAAAPAAAASPAQPPAPAASPEPSPAKQTPEASVTGLVDPLKTALDDLTARFDQQKQTLAALKLKEQTLDDDYPLLHRELSGQIEKLTSDLFWLKWILVVLGLGSLLGVFLYVNARNRTTPGMRRKQELPGNTGKRPEAQGLREEPLKLILERIYKLEQELGRLQEQLIHEEKTADGEDAITEKTPPGKA